MDGVYTASRSDICQSGNDSQLGAVSWSTVDKKGSDIGVVHHALSAIIAMQCTHTMLPWLSHDTFFLDVDEGAQGLLLVAGSSSRSADTAKGPGEEGVRAGGTEGDSGFRSPESLD